MLDFQETDPTFVDPEQDKSTNLLLIIPSKMLAESIARHLNERGRFQVSIAHSLKEAVSLFTVKENLPELILFDPSSPRIKELETLKQVLGTTQDVDIALLAESFDGFYVNNAIRHGARGIISKTLTLCSLENALGLIAGGEIFIPADKNAPASMSVQLNGQTIGLTNIERQSLELSAEGFSNKEIATEMELTEARVKGFARLVCKKLNARNRTHAVAKAISLDLI